jgi:hypothetical protein
MWLWKVKNYISFDEGYRVEPFSGFAGEVQFDAEARRLAERAAEEVRRYRSLFPNISRVCEFYLERPPLNGGHWWNFHSAIACGLAGRPVDAVRFFDCFLHGQVNGPEWLIAARADTEKLKTQVAETIEFRRAISARVRRTREMQRLPALAEIDFDATFPSKGVLE